MNGLCNIIRNLPSNAVSQYVHLYLDYQLQKAQCILQNIQQPNASNQIQLILRILTVFLLSLLLLLIGYYSLYNSIFK